MRRLPSPAVPRIRSRALGRRRGNALRKPLIGRVDNARMSLLDALRFVAALGVVAYHFSASPSVSSYLGGRPSEVFPVLNEVSRYGWIAVQFFFVISGIVILKSARNRTLRQFVASRIARLYPSYWACVLLTFGLLLLWDGERSPSLWTVLANLTMVQGQVGVENLQTVFWTLLVELKFYVLVGLLLHFGPLTDRRVLWFAALWPSVGVAILVGQSLITSGPLVIVLSSLAGILVPMFAPFFAVGILLVLVRENSRSPKVWAVLLYCLVLSMLSIGIAATEAADLQGVLVSPAVAVGVFLGSMVAISLSMVVRVGARLGDLCGALGALTYGLYLVHMEFGFAAIDLLNPALGPLGAVLLALLGVLLLAAGLTALVDRRVTARFRRFLEGSQPAREQDGAAANDQEGRSLERLG